jgi:hypothetical protein
VGEQIAVLFQRGVDFLGIEGGVYILPVGSILRREAAILGYGTYIASL